VERKGGKNLGAKRAAAIAACCHQASADIVNVILSSGYVQAASANLQNKLLQKILSALHI
jgi:hypothetical protein